MTKDTITDFQYQADKINKALHELSRIYSEISFFHEIDQDGSEEYKISTRTDNFEFIAKRLYNMCTAFLELKGIPKYLSRFEKTIKPFYKDQRSLMKGVFDEDSGEDYSKLVSEVWQFLMSFKEFHQDDGDITKMQGLTYLEHILESTAVIIKDSKTPVKSEHQVYKAVSLITKATFVDVEFPTQSFQKKAVCYIPDILIPSLNCAIEYKYAKDERTLIATIDQILIDVKGYANHPTYKLFYAVFYVKAGIWTKQRFEEVWNEKEFPKNWKWVFVEGA